ncbi:MAG TPA: flagellar basal-body MS-ring/collar protein FliF [Nocardioidaceae bacterium]|nr:flagellar basal-body MS-ring/collar protein FliF [Nocardioidaceae bacterium]
MREQLTGRLASLQRTFASFSAGQKTTAVIGALALLFAGVLVFRWAASPSYAPLYSNLAPSDASAVIQKLDADGTPYKLTGGGNTIMVPKSQVYDERIKLSGEGLPANTSTAGYSLLDKQSLSTSQFQEQTSYKRAIEGELEKTIEALDAVDTAVVHVAMPQEKLFETDQKPVTASVLVAVHPGTTLGTSQVQAIVHLVASSVSGLDPNQVTVTDSAGNVLAAAGDSASIVADTRAQQVQSFEDRMKQSVSSMLDRVLGTGNSAVDVTADLNFDQTVTHTTRYFSVPNSTPLSASTTTETYKAPQGSGQTGGVVGPDGALVQGGTAPPGTTKYSKKQKTSDNAVGQSVQDLTAAPGNVKSLHVGVVLDTQSLAGRKPSQIQSLISSALGIDPKRGDTVSVTAMPFDRTAEKAAKAALAKADAADQKAHMLSMGKTAGLVVLLGLVLLLAWRSARKKEKARQQATTYVVEQLRRTKEPEPVAAAPPTAELPAPDVPELRMAARDEIAALVERQPEEVAQLLRGWLVESGASK